MEKEDQKSIPDKLVRDTINTMKTKKEPSSEGISLSRLFKSDKPFIVGEAVIKARQHTTKKHN